MVQNKIDVEYIHKNFYDKTVIGELYSFSHDYNVDKNVIFPRKCGKTFVDCCELATCINFGNKNIICQLSFLNDINHIIKTLTNFIFPEYKIFKITKIAPYRWYIENIFVTFIVDIDKNIGNDTECYFIDFRR